MVKISTWIWKSDYDTKIAEIESKCFINTGFDPELAQGMLLQKEILIQKLLRLKIILKNYKHLIQAILEVKTILKKIVHNFL